MPRLPRCCPPAIPQHIIQRGNNRQPCFAGKPDFSFYLNCMNEAARSCCVDIHAWVLMSNHVHILATPHLSDGISRMMQGIGRRYVLYFNKRYRRSGTLWEGRFRSCLIDSEQYLLRCYHYIEMNPVRAGIIGAPEDYPWSSYKCNALGKQSRLIVPHAQYQSLGKTPQERAMCYRNLCRELLTQQQVQDIRKTVNSGMALGSERFKDEMEMLLKRRVRPAIGEKNAVPNHLNNGNGF